MNKDLAGAYATSSTTAPSEAAAGPRGHIEASVAGRAASRGGCGGSRSPAAEGGAEVPSDSAERFLDLMPRLKRRFEANLPADVRTELATVTSNQMGALCHLVGGGGVTMHELARAQGCGMSSATSLGERLHRQGLARRVPDPEDRRVVRLVATPKATALIDRFRSSRRETAVAALEALSPGEVEQLILLLDRVAGPEGHRD